MCPECERLRRRVEELELLVGEPVLAPPNGFTRIRWNYFCALARRGALTREQLFTAVYGRRHESEQPTDDRTVDATVARVRACLRPYNIRIDAIYGVGYKIREGDRENARLLLQGDLYVDRGILKRRNHSNGQALPNCDHLLTDPSDISAA